MVSSMAGFAINDALVKSLGDSLSTSQLLGVRGTMVSFLIGLVLWQRGLLPRWRQALIPMVGLRAAMELGAAYCFLAALVQLPFASVSAILQALPLVVTLGAALVFREVVGWRRWTAITIGFVGVLIIIRPGTNGFAPASLWVVVSVFFAAARDLSTRALPASLPSLLVTAVTAMLIAVFGLVSVTLSGDWVPLELSPCKGTGTGVGLPVCWLSVHRTGHAHWRCCLRGSLSLQQSVCGVFFWGFCSLVKCPMATPSSALHCHRHGPVYAVPGAGTRPAGTAAIRLGFVCVRIEGAIVHSLRDCVIVRSRLEDFFGIFQPSR